MNEITKWCAVATSRLVVGNAVKMALIVGCLLAVINHGDALFRGEFSRDRLLKIAITFCVPYLVSTISSVNALRAIRREQV